MLCPYLPPISKTCFLFVMKENIGLVNTWKHHGIRWTRVVLGIWLVNTWKHHRIRWPVGDNIMTHHIQKPTHESVHLSIPLPLPHTRMRAPRLSSPRHARDQWSSSIVIPCPVSLSLPILKTMNNLGVPFDVLTAIRDQADVFSSADLKHTIASNFKSY